MYQNKRQIEARETARAWVSISMILIGFIWLGASVGAVTSPVNQVVLSEVGKE